MPRLSRLLSLRPRLHAGRALLIGLPFGWLLAFFLLPFLIVLKYSVSRMGEIAVGDVIQKVDGGFSATLKYANFVHVLTDGLYADAYLSSLEYAGLTTLCCLAIGYPFAYFMARAKPSAQPTLLMLVTLPFWTSFLLRVYSWKGLLSPGGWVYEALVRTHASDVLARMGFIDEPTSLMHTAFSLVLGMTYTYLPFMILPLYSNLAKLDLRLLEAAADLGATPWTAFWRVTVPLSWPGIFAGSMLVFIPCIGDYVTPELLGGPRTLMIGRVIWDEYFSNNDPPMACAVAALLVLLIVVPLAMFNKYKAELQETPR